MAIDKERENRGAGLSLPFAHWQHSECCERRRAAGLHRTENLFVNIWRLSARLCLRIVKFDISEAEDFYHVMSVTFVELPK